MTLFFFVMSLNGQDIHEAVRIGGEKKVVMDHPEKVNAKDTRGRLRAQGGCRGTLSRYSGDGFCIMQQAVMDVEQKDFPEIQQENVLTPLSMLSSTFEQSFIPGGHYIYPEMAAGGLWTIPADLARFLIEVQLSLVGRSNLVINRTNTELMLTPVLSDDYGLGFSLFDVNGEPYFGHGGPL